MATGQMTPRFWDDVKIGDIVQMKDEQALQDSMKRGRGLVPIDYVVSEIRKIDEIDDLCERLNRDADIKAEWI